MVVVVVVVGAVVADGGGGCGWFIEVCGRCFYYYSNELFVSF